MEKTENINYKLEEPINFTDPFVLHDVQQSKPIIVQLYRTDDVNPENEEDLGNGTDVSPIKTNGITYPIVQINTKVIDYNQIINMEIFYDSFLPTIKIQISDTGGLIQRTDIPGYNNTLKVIIVPEIENIYKSISLDFRITSVETNVEEVTKKKDIELKTNDGTKIPMTIKTTTVKYTFIKFKN